MPFLTRNRVIEYPSALPLSCQEDRCFGRYTPYAPREKFFNESGRSLHASIRRD